MFSGGFTMCGASIEFVRSMRISVYIHKQFQISGRIFMKFDIGKT
jgi:hypothetical protein